MTDELTGPTGLIGRLLVANRAEIASRIFRTCRRLGIETVAVHSDADADLPYVAEADHAVRLPGNSPAETYLRGDLLVDAARRTGADAVHPGYGFGSESAPFAAAVEAAGLTWVGPTPESMAAMGSKIEAKRIMAAAGVPILEAPPNPGPADFPLLVKASAGGGGRGMRIVRDAGLLAGELAAARAEAAAAFGDGRVFCEPYVERARHVEVQVLGDGHGEVLVLGERDCSLQRRHQKVLEESPAPGLSEETRSALHRAAGAAAASLCYRGAGTVEFLYHPVTARFWFLEMNTRLQVEHPVTELVHGVDLVEWQLRVAEGGRLPRREHPADGHAIEVRLYAEDPAADYRPQSGVLTRFEIPESPGIRVDAGYAAGSTVSTFYDAMLAKVIAHGDTRAQAVRRLLGALRRARIGGLVTNREQLIDALGSPAFAAGDVSTALLGERDPTVVRTDAGAPIAAALALAERTRARRAVQRGIPVAWRNVVSQPQRTEFEEHPVVEWYGTRDGYLVDGAEVIDAAPDRVVLARDGVRTTYEVAIDATGTLVEVDSPVGHTRLVRRPRFADPSAVMAPGSLVAPMPGTVVSVAVAVGDRVEAGHPLLVLEAMKMQHTVSAPTGGVIAAVAVERGRQVAAGETLIVIEE
ncbi:MAG: biotin carboxylase N-terminal domain-containing protein [Nocardioides sp.]|uniref:ATP-binding protein n=1 Tax=Nocardioides sp. TaxID=35761 RepID=UPI0039E2EDD9